MTQGLNSSIAPDARACLLTPVPDMDIRGAGISISSGDATPDTSDNTDFGSAAERRSLRGAWDMVLR